MEDQSDNTLTPENGAVQLISTNKLRCLALPRAIVYVSSAHRQAERLASPRASSKQMQRPNPRDRALGVHAIVRRFLIVRDESDERKEISNYNRP